MPDLKPELSVSNKYWIPKHRYYELKHYCMQYKHWKELARRIEFKMAVFEEVRGTEPTNPTEKMAVVRADCKRAMELVENCCKEASPELKKYLLKGVTEGLPYDVLKVREGIPCSKDMYYDRYRKFFYILSQKRGI